MDILNLIQVLGKTEVAFGKVVTTMTLTPLMEDQSEAETEHSGIISGYETEVCTSPLGPSW